MKKFLMFPLNALFVGILAVGCTAPFYGKVSEPLPNGYVPTSEEEARLEAMVSRANSATARVLNGIALTDMNSATNANLVSTYLRLLESEFGVDYKKFAICEKTSIVIDAASGIQIGAATSQFVDPEDTERPIVLDQRAISVFRAQVNEEASNGYFIVMDMYQWSFPWNGWNVAKSWFKVWTNKSAGQSANVTAPRLSVGLIDRNSNVSRSATNTNVIEAVGNAEAGWYPKYSSTSSHTVESPNIADGTFTCGRSWN